MACSGGCCGPPSEPGLSEDKGELNDHSQTSPNSCEAVNEPEDEGCSCCDDDDESEENDKCEEKSGICNDDDRGCEDSCCSSDNNAEDCCPSPTQSPTALNDPASACCPTDEVELEAANTEAIKEACPCCVSLLVDRFSQGQDLSRPPFQAAKAHVPSSFDTLEPLFQASVRALKQCCRLLERDCARLACCYESIPDDKPRTPAMTREKKAEHLPTQDTPVIVTRGKAHQFTVTGLDCPDCARPITKACQRLPSVQRISFDYFTGTLGLEYNPEIIVPEGIARYIARATGFTVTSLESGEYAKAQTIQLPITLGSYPDAELLSKLGVTLQIELGRSSRAKASAFHARLLIPSVNGPPPREVMNALKQFSPTLIPADDITLSNPIRRDVIATTMRCLVGLVCCIPVLVMAWAPLPDNPAVYGALSVFFSSVVVIAGWPIFSAGIRHLIFLGTPDFNLLVAISCLLAYGFSIVAYAFELAGKRFATPFFETVVLVLTIIYVGRTAQAWSRHFAGSAIDEICRLQTTDVVLLPDETPIDARLLHYGDIVRVAPHTRVVTDGIVVAGTSDVDESTLTGESVPVSKSIGTSVKAGTLNLDGRLDVQVTQLLHENSVARTAELVKRAQSSKPAIADMADRIASYVLPTAVFCACAALIIWVMIDKFVRGWRTVNAVVDGLSYAIAILIVSCPCALGLMIPLANSVAIRIAVKRGVLFQTADTLQTAHLADIIAFDKTGTLTNGVFSVHRAEFFGLNTEQLVLTLVSGNNHPVSQSIAAHLRDRGITVSDAILGDMTSIPGQGIKADIAGYTLLGGSPSFTCLDSHPLVMELVDTGVTMFAVSLGGQPLALFTLSDTPRLESARLISRLHYQGKRVMILSGDNQAAAERLATFIGIPTDSDHLYTGCSPEDKASVVTTLQKNGHKVCFVGDGANDGPALATAHVSLAISSGSEVALTSAGAVIRDADIQSGILSALKISFWTSRHTYIGLGWAVTYNIFAILLASGALVHVRIEPRWAGLGELASVLPVLALAFSLHLRNVVD